MRGRSVATLNGLVAAALVGVLAVVALVVKPPAPPGIAEFAPQAAKPITKAPQQQGSSVGLSAGECPPGAICAPPRPTKAPVGARPLPTERPVRVPAKAQCFEWPDGSVTQTFDPQSPPCILTWDDSHGNGGATSRGVDPTTVRIAVPMTSQYRKDETVVAVLRSFASFFNSRYQLYDRQIVLVPYASQSLNAPSRSNQSEMQAADAKTVEQLRAFASVDLEATNPASSSQQTYLGRLAAAGIVATTEASSYLPDSFFADRAPYLWAFQPQATTMYSALATVVCRQLKGRPARHAGDVTWRSTPRTFALLRPNTTYMGGLPPPDVRRLLTALSSCGVSPSVYEYGGSADSTTAAELLRKKVTTALLLTANGKEVTFSFWASQAGYHPEWLLSGQQNRPEASWGDYPDQANSVMSLWPFPKPRTRQNEIWYRAMTSSRANYYGTNFRRLYEQLQLLVAGIQMAGPRLTPTTFAQGLRGTIFPNPGAGQSPSYQGRIDLSDKPVAIADVALAWYDLSSKDPDGRQGSWCFVERGRRWRIHDIPAREAFRTGPCR